MIINNSNIILFNDILVFIIIIIKNKKNNNYYSQSYTLVSKKTVLIIKGPSFTDSFINTLHIAMGPQLTVLIIEVSIISESVSTIIAAM